MATNYTPNVSAAQSPSPAPGPGVSPIDALPQYTDGSDPGNFYQAFKTHADFIAFLNTAARWMPPVTYGDAIGFSAVVHVGAGSGVLAPFGSNHAGLNIVIKIIVGGVTGVATYQYSTDGGTTYSATATTAATVSIGATGVSISFQAGTFAALDTYQFRQAATPFARFVDQLGNGRFLVDHNGLPLGRIYRVQESWRVNVAPATADPWANYGHMRASIVAGGRYSTAATAQFGPTLVVKPGVANLDKCFVYQDGFSFSTGPSNSIWVAEWEFLVSRAADPSSLYMGLASGSDGTSTDAVWFRVPSGTANWQAEVLVSGGSPITITADTGIVADSGSYRRARIEWHQASSPLGLTFGGTRRAIFYIDDLIVASAVTNNPNTPLRMIFGGICAGACAATAPMQISSVDLAMARVPSADL